MERRGCEQRRILEASPVDRRAEYAERAVHRCDFVPAPMLGFEPRDFRGLFESRHRQLTE